MPSRRPGRRTTATSDRPHRGLIIGGTVALDHKYDFVSSLRSFGQHYCGAALIAAQWAVTAAHCLPSRSGSLPGRFTLVIHPAHMDCSLEVLAWTSHPDYNADTYEADLAVLHVSQPHCAAHVVKPRLDDGNIPIDQWPHQNATAAGWGTTQFSRNPKPGAHFPYSTVLRRVVLPILTDATCITAMGVGARYYFPAVMLCAGHLDNHTADTCDGDSGGPLFMEPPGPQTEAVLVGITSWGYGCGLHGYPGVYTEVAVFRSWVLSVVTLDPSHPPLPPAPSAPSLPSTPAPAPRSPTLQGAPYPTASPPPTLEPSSTSSPCVSTPLAVPLSPQNALPQIPLPPGAWQPATYLKQKSPSSAFAFAAQILLPSREHPAFGFAILVALVCIAVLICSMLRASPETRAQAQRRTVEAETPSRVKVDAFELVQVADMEGEIDSTSGGTADASSCRQKVNVTLKVRDGRARRQRSSGGRVHRKQRTCEEAAPLAE